MLSLQIALIFTVNTWVTVYGLLGRGCTGHPLGSIQCAHPSTYPAWMCIRICIGLTWVYGIYSNVYRKRASEINKLQGVMSDITRFRVLLQSLLEMK